MRKTRKVRLFLSADFVKLFPERNVFLEELLNDDHFSFHPFARTCGREPAMLVLSRRPEEAIVLPELGIRIKVLAVKPGVVRIGIEAPPDVAVWREELLEKSAAQNAEIVCHV